MHFGIFKFSSIFFLQQFFAIDFHDFLLLEYYKNTQSYLEKVKKNYLKLRNFHHQLQPWIVQYVIGHLAAEAMSNTTVVCSGHPEFKRDHYPQLLPFVQLFDESGRNVNVIWSNYLNGMIYSKLSSQERPVFVKMDSVSLSFGLCAIPERERDSTWDFSIFTQSLDIWTWLCLLVALLMISALSFCHEYLNFSPALLPALSVLLTPGPSELSGKLRKHSKLLVLWMLCSYVVTTFYTGNMTGQVISPAGEERLTKFKELEEHNFTLVFRDKVSEGIIVATAEAMTKRNFVQEQLKVLGRLIRNSILRTNVNDSFIKTLTESILDTVVIRGWPLVILAVNDANNYIRQQISQNAADLPEATKKKRKICYLGQELISGGEMFFAFLPPGSSKAASYFQNLVSSGIIERWTREWLSLAYSSRVQDRVKFINPLQIKEDEGVLNALKMEGKTVKIFFLWTFCLVLCVVSVSIELIGYYNYR